MMENLKEELPTPLFLNPRHKSNFVCLPKSMSFLEVSYIQKLFRNGKKSVLERKNKYFGKFLMFSAKRNGSY